MKEAGVHIYILPLMTAAEVITYVEIDRTTMETSPPFSEQKCGFKHSQHVLTSIFLTHWLVVLPGFECYNSLVQSLIYVLFSFSQV